MLQKFKIAVYAIIVGLVLPSQAVAENPHLGGIPAAASCMGSDCSQNLNRQLCLRGTPGAERKHKICMYERGHRWVPAGGGTRTMRIPTALVVIHVRTYRRSGTHTMRRDSNSLPMYLLPAARASGPKVLMRTRPTGTSIRPSSSYANNVRPHVTRIQCPGHAEFKARGPKCRF